MKMRAIKKVKMRSILYVFLIFILIQVSACQPNIANLKSNGASIICFGDEATRGKGSTEGNDYPSLLSQKLNKVVINTGVNGDTTRDALKRIEEDVLEVNPRLVIVEFSRNDYLKEITKQETLDNIDKMVEMIQQRQAMVVLVEVSIGGYVDQGYVEGFKRISKKRQTLLVTVGADEEYSIIAEKIYQAIKPLLN